jgi:AraC-like DNA-binding protein
MAPWTVTAKEPRHRAAVQDAVRRTRTISRHPASGRVGLVAWVTATTITHVARAVATLGGDADALLADPALAPRRFEDRIRVETIIELWERAHALTQRRDLPAVAAQYAAHDERSLLAFLVSNQPRFGDAIERFVRFFPTVGDAYAWRLVDGEAGGIHLAAIPPGPIHQLGFQLHVEFELIDSVRSAAIVTEGRAVPFEVRLLHASPPPEVVTAFAALLGTTPAFDRERCEVIYPASVREIPLPAARPALAGVVERQLQEMLDAIAMGTATTTRARAAIGSLLGTRRCDVDAIARALHMSRRSLERALSAEGTSAGALIDEERKQRALAWLPALSVEQVALRLGYSDRRALARAFRRWTGAAPKQSRRA